MGRDVDALGVPVPAWAQATSNGKAKSTTKRANRLHSVMRAVEGGMCPALLNAAVRPERLAELIRDGLADLRVAVLAMRWFGALGAR